MAIAKVKTKKVEWTPASIIQLSIAGALLIASIIMIYAAVRSYGLKRNFANALAAFDTNDIGNAEPALENALGWDPDHWWARELLAKMKADNGSDLVRAEQEYKKLLENELARKGTAYYGLGVIALKRADANWAAADAQVEEARKYFKQAQQANGSMVEPAIGLLHCELISLRRSSEGKGVDRAKARDLAMSFKKILDSLLSNRQQAATVSKEGYLDLYCGLGWAHAMAGGNESEAAKESVEAALKYLRSCSQYAPRLIQAKASIVYLEAQSFADGSFTAAAFSILDPGIRGHRGDLKSQWSRRGAGYDALKEAWCQYCMATSFAVGRTNNAPTYRGYKWEMDQSPEMRDRLELPLLDAIVWYGMAAQAPDLYSRNLQMNEVRVSIERLMMHPDMSKPESAPFRAAALNNLGWATEQQAAYEMSDAKYETAIGQWKESIRIEDSYEPNRNIAVVQKRRGKPDAEEWLGKAVKAAQKNPTSRVQMDLAELNKFFRGGK